jgi:hypothetical protein
MAFAGLQAFYDHFWPFGQCVNNSNLGKPLQPLMAFTVIRSLYKSTWTIYSSLLWSLSFRWIWPQYTFICAGQCDHLTLLNKVSLWLIFLIPILLMIFTFFVSPPTGFNISIRNTHALLSWDFFNMLIITWHQPYLSHLTPVTKISILN